MKFDDFKELGSEAAVKVKIFFYSLCDGTSIHADFEHVVCSFPGRFSDGAIGDPRLPLLDQ